MDVWAYALVLKHVQPLTVYVFLCLCGGRNLHGGLHICMQRISFELCECVAPVRPVEGLFSLNRDAHVINVPYRFCPCNSSTTGPKTEGGTREGPGEESSDLLLEEFDF